MTSYFDHNRGKGQAAPALGDTVEFDHTHPGFEIHAGVVVHFGRGEFKPTFTGGVGIARPPSRADCIAAGCGQPDDSQPSHHFCGQ